MSLSDDNQTRFVVLRNISNRNVKQLNLNSQCIWFRLLFQHFDMKNLRNIQIMSSSYFNHVVILFQSLNKHLLFSADRCEWHNYVYKMMYFPYFSYTLLWVLLSAYLVDSCRKVIVTSWTIIQESSVWLFGNFLMCSLIIHCQSCGTLGMEFL